MTYLDQTKEKITAREWFAHGERLPYDIRKKKILHPNQASGNSNVVYVFERNDVAGNEDEGTLWSTFLPGFPDGSYGWAQVNEQLPDDALSSRLFVEYVGQGDSDKPSNYLYNTMERADLVEAIWEFHGVRSTYVVTFDYSSLVILELLSRQLEKMDQGIQPFTKIESILIVNGGFYADAHSHPWYTSPLLKTSFGRMGTWMAQRSRLAFDNMVGVLWSKEYNVTKEELYEVYDAISRRGGASFMSKAAGFVDEHQMHADRWDLNRLFFAFRDSISFHVAGSQGDVFEPGQVVKAKEQLGRHGLDIRMLPGGHLTTSEHPELLAGVILDVNPARQSLIESAK